MAKKTRKRASRSDSSRRDFIAGYMAAMRGKKRRAGIYGDDGWEEESPGYWVNYGLSDDIPSIFHDEELDGTGREYVVQVNGAETIDDDMLTESFGSLNEAVAYAESIV